MKCLLLKEMINKDSRKVKAAAKERMIDGYRRKGLVELCTNMNMSRCERIALNIKQYHPHFSTLAKMPTTLNHEHSEHVRTSMSADRKEISSIQPHPIQPFKYSLPLAPGSEESWLSQVCLDLLLLLWPFHLEVVHVA